MKLRLASDDHDVNVRSHGAIRAGAKLVIGWLRRTLQGTADGPRLPVGR